MARYNERGLEARHEQDQRMLIRDTRTLAQRMGDFFADAFNTTVLLVTMATTVLFFPMTADIALLFGVGLFLFTYTRRVTLPFRMPQVCKRMDYNDLKAGTDNPQPARGICFLGNDRRTNEELWFANDDMRTHVLIFGSTGSGKTVALTSIAYNALLHASGFIYVDGKGDNTLYANLFSMARSMGREDDVLVVNFMTGARDVFGPQEKRLSNTLNPFATGSSSMLAQLVVSLMDSSSGSGDGDMWKGRAISFVEALMKTLVYMRDAGHILLDANSIRNYFLLPKLESIVVDKMFPRDKQEPVSLEGAPEVILEPLSGYLDNLPGYDRSKKGKQVSQVLEQHGFITMQLTRVFTSLADTYGHILRTNLAEVDLRDVVLNRRILIVLLPALEKSPAELSNLGKIIVASLKATMSAGLGSELEGTYGELVLRKPTDSPTPFMCILDEYGYYAVEGFAVVPAQARSLGFSAIFAGQDLPAFQKASKEEAASIGANTNIKIAMKLEDPTDTWDFFNKTAGESYVTKVDAFQTNPNSVMNTYLDTRSSSAEKRARIDLLDLKEQREGEAHIFFKSKIVRARMFYAGPKPARYMRLSHYLKIAAPPTRQLIELEERTRRFEQAAEHFHSLPPMDKDNEDITLIISNIRTAEASTPIECSVNALLAYHEAHSPKAIEEEAVEELPWDELNIFAPFRMADPTVPIMVGETFEQFSNPLVKRGEARSKMELVERLSGKSSKHATGIADEIIKDMELATYYPPIIERQPTAEELAALVEELIIHIGQKAAVQQSSTEDDFDDD